MPDSKEHRNSPDSKRININESYEVQYWSKKFGVSATELKDAVDKAGTSAEAVKNYFGK
jgi:hypothetical protein